MNDSATSSRSAGSPAAATRPTLGGGFYGSGLPVASVIECDRPVPGELAPIRTRSGAQEPAVGPTPLVPVGERLRPGTQPRVTEKPLEEGDRPDEELSLIHI